MEFEDMRRVDGAEKLTPKVQRVMHAATGVGAAWVVDARKPPMKKRAPRRKSPPPSEGVLPPWYFRNWSSAAAVVAALFSIGTFLHSSGWLSAPAKQDDVVKAVEKIAQLEKHTSEADARISGDIQVLTTELKEQRGAVFQFGAQLSRAEGKLDEALRSLPRSILRGRSMQNDAAQ
jgi:hypothetical protein